MSTERNNKGNSKVMLISSAIILVLLALVLVSRLGSKSPSQPKPIAERLQTPISLDTNVKNALTCGSLAVTDEYIFYSNTEGLYRINKDGSGRLELESGEISNINIYNDYLYYSKRIAEDKIIGNANYTHNIIKQSFDGSEKTEITNVSCQRVGAMLVANDLIIHRLIVFEGDGGKNDAGNPTGELISKYKAISIDNEHSGDVFAEQFSSIMTLNYPYNQSELDQYLRDEYPNISLKSSKYSVSDTMFFDGRSTKDPRYTAIFSISKKDNKINLITKYDPVAEDNYTIDSSISGFSYNESDNSLYYILTMRKKVKEANSINEKLDLCKLDLSNNSITVIDTILDPEDF